MVTLKWARTFHNAAAAFASYLAAHSSQTLVFIAVLDADDNVG